MRERDTLRPKTDQSKRKNRNRKAKKLKMRQKERNMEISKF